MGSRHTAPNRNRQQALTATSPTHSDPPATIDRRWSTPNGTPPAPGSGSHSTRPPAVRAGRAKAGARSDKFSAPPKPRPLRPGRDAP
eukprot:scaffold24159_cov117-Isochrysis_galbana.AAC.2